MLAENQVPTENRPRVVVPRPVAQRALRPLIGGVDPLAELLHDQRLCLRLGRAVEGFGVALRSGQQTRIGDLRTFARVFRVLVDDWQHERWEHVLMPWMVRHGLSYTSPLVAELGDVYSLERHSVEVLAEFAERERSLCDIEKQSVARTALELAALEQRLWVRLANDIVPALRRRSNDAQLDELARALARFDELHTAKASCSRALSESRDLIARYGAAPPVGMGSAVEARS